MANGNGGYLHVKNWARFQHYKNRHPTWIKLYRDLLQDHSFRRLPDVVKSQLMLIWLLASSQHGLVPNDADYLKNVLGLKRKPNTKLLIEQGFLIESASTMLAQRREETEKRREEESKPVDKSLETKTRNAADLARSLARRHVTYS